MYKVQAMLPKQIGRTDMFVKFKALILVATTLIATTAIAGYGDKYKMKKDIVDTAASTSDLPSSHQLMKHLPHCQLAQ
jgi:hypothetical protein